MFRSARGTARSATSVWLAWCVLCKLAIDLACLSCFRRRRAVTSGHEVLDRLHTYVWLYDRLYSCMWLYSMSRFHGRSLRLLHSTSWPHGVMLTIVIALPAELRPAAGPPLCLAEHVCGRCKLQPLHCPADCGHQPHDLPDCTRGSSVCRDIHGKAEVSEASGRMAVARHLAPWRAGVHLNTHLWTRHHTEGGQNAMYTLQHL